MHWCAWAGLTVNSETGRATPVDPVEGTPTPGPISNDSLRLPGTEGSHLRLKPNLKQGGLVTPRPQCTVCCLLFPAILNTWLLQL